MRNLRERWSDLSASMRLRLLVIPILLISAAVPTVWGLARNHDWAGLAVNFGTGMGSTLMTFILIDLLIGTWERRETETRANAEHRARLILQLRSKNNGIALQAVEELRAHGWLLEDGALRGADLYRANLEGANLAQVNLNGAVLRDAILQGAFMRSVNLEAAALNRCNLRSAVIRDANLRGADLSDAILERADLRDSILDGADLAHADLSGADLRGASLRNANLSGAKLERAGFSRAVLEGADLSHANLLGAKSLTDDLLRTLASLENATLPDGTVYKSHVENQASGG